MATTEFLIGQRLTADLLNANVIDYPTTSTSIGTAAAGFTASAQQARIALGGKFVDVALFLNRTGADITQTNTNIADTACFTLDSDYWPTETRNCWYGNGSMDGEATISTAGVVTLRSASYTIVSGTNVRICVSFTRA